MKFFFGSVKDTTDNPNKNGDEGRLGILSCPSENKEKPEQKLPPGVQIPRLPQVRISIS